jgi:hypothetical protein
MLTISSLTFLGCSDTSPNRVSDETRSDEDGACEEGELSRVKLEVQGYDYNNGSCIFYAVVTEEASIEGQRAIEKGDSFEIGTDESPYWPGIRFCDNVRDGLGESGEDFRMTATVACREVYGDKGPNLKLEFGDNISHGAGQWATCDQGSLSRVKTQIKDFDYNLGDCSFDAIVIQEASLSGQQAIESGHTFEVRPTSHRPGISTCQDIQEGRDDYGDEFHMTATVGCEAGLEEGEFDLRIEWD